MREQFQPRRDEPPSPQPGPKRERPKGFVLHERAGSEIEERRAVPLMEEVKAEQLAVDRIAQRIVRELSADRGRLREPEAAMQNMLTRAIIQGRVGNPDLFIRQVKEACLKLGQQVTKDVERIFVGVAANIQGINRVAEEHRAEKGARFPKQFIGTNDRIDAADQVDLVDIRFRDTEDGGSEVGRVRLVQVKNAELKESDLAAIHRAHAGFHGRLAGASEVERELLDEEVEGRLSSGEAYAKGMEEKSLEERHEAEKEYFGDFILEYMAAKPKGPLDDEMVRGWFGGKPLAILKMRFRHEHARALFDVIAKSLASTPEEIKSINGLFNELKAWASANPPETEELRELAQGSPAGLMKAASFESVVIHGSKTSTLSLGGFGEGKGLTKK